MSIREAIATHLGWDINDVEYYQPHAWSKKIVTTDDDWYCATRSAKKPIVKSNRGDALSDWELAETLGNIHVWKRKI